MPSRCSKTTRLELLISFLGPCLWACQQGLHWIRFPQGFVLGVVVACLHTCAPSVPAYMVWLLAFRWLASHVFLLVHGHTSSMKGLLSHIVSQSFQTVDRVTSWQLSRHKTTEASAPNKALSSHHVWHIPLWLLFAALAVHTAFPLSSAFVQASYALLTSV